MKTKYLIISKKQKGTILKINAAEMERAKTFKYLGVQLNKQWDGCLHGNKIPHRNGKRSVFQIWQNMDQSLYCTGLKTRFIKYYLRSVLLYGAEVWRVKKVDEQILEAFEM